MHENLIIAGGIYHIMLIIFHLLFWRIFDWPKTLQPSHLLNTATTQVLNLSITFIFALFAYISLAHTQELLGSPLGYALLIGISGLWLFRAVQQAIFYKLRHIASIALFLFFLTGALLYGVPTLG